MKLQMTNIRNVRGGITTDIKSIIREQLHFHKFNKLDEMGQFLERHESPTFN